VKPLGLAAVASALTTAVAAWALRATDPAAAVAAVAAIAVLVGWLTRFHDTATTSGLALSGPSQLASLALVGRASAGTALPVVAAQVVGAVAAGAAVGALDLPGGALVWDQPELLAAGVLGVVVGLVTAWATLAADVGTPAWQGAGPVVAGGLLGVGLAAAAQPAAVLGLATAGLLTWPVALAVVAGVLVGTVVGTFVVSWLSPHDA
jgi:hypothetical protein